MEDEESLEDEIRESLEETLNETLIDSTEERPADLFILPLNRRPFFPGMTAPVVIDKGKYYEVLKKVANSEDKCIGLVLTKEENTPIGRVTFKDLHKVGVMARILRIVPIENGGAQVVLSMEERFEIERPIKGKYLKAKAGYFIDAKEVNDELKAYAINIVTVIKELLKLNPLFKEELQVFLGHSDFTEPGRLADFAVALTTASAAELQEILESFEIQTRIDKALILLKKELDLSRLQSSINQKIEATITKTQKEFFLREQLKTIKKELGIEKDEKQIDVEKFEKRLARLDMPDDVLEVVQEEIDKLSALEPVSAEYSVARNYLDWLTSIPWGVMSKERHDLVRAENVLHKDHYGLEEIKERILELISVGKLSGGLRGSIICLVGPPGVGKTSVGRSIARALNRKFFRFSVGGMRDEAEIKGHRRTYVGAMPGKLIQALKQSQAMNPVIMIDEVDKIGFSYQGDPASALLEVLDPQQNKDFLDHYLDVRTDLSNVLFILTANMIDTIPEALVDRMEVLRLAGYVAEEKVQIAKKFLIPRNRKEMGLTAKQVQFTDQALRAIIHSYAREAGVRSFENHIKKILRKVALEVVRKQQKIKRTRGSESFRITKSNLEEFLGKPIFVTDRFYQETPIGVASGLAWTSLGGALLYIECIKVAAERTEMILTGQAGDVMKESSQIAWNYLHSAIHKYAPGHPFFEKSQIHIHIPEGATPKDGPSAGITMVTALLSLLLEEPVVHNLGMTGEITLTGRILGIGGVREKLVAAKRSGLDTLIFPIENKRDFEELPPFLKEGVNVHFVEHYDEVFKLAFPRLNS